MSNRPGRHSDEDSAGVPVKHLTVVEGRPLPVNINMDKLVSGL